MRKTTLAFLFILLLGGGVLGVLGAMGRLPLPVLKVLGTDHAVLTQRTLAFLTDLKFKDFAQAATYHAPELQGSVDIPYLIQRVFAVKPELLEIMDYEVLYAEVDDSNLRARVKTRTKIKALNEGSIRDVELLFYYYRGGPGQPWYMKLEDSLRQVKPEEGKAH